MRRLLATFLIVAMVISLVGPYYAEAEEYVTDNNQTEVENDNLLIEEKIGNQNPTLSSNQLDKEDVSEGESADIDLIESVDMEETSIEESITGQSDSPNIDKKDEAIESDKQNENKSNEAISEEAPLELKGEIVEENSSIQATTVETELRQQIAESSTSKLGKIKSTAVKIFRDLHKPSSFFTAGTTYTNSVYYIKKQAVTEGQTYYLISHKPSSVNGIIGWVKASDLTTYDHKGVDKDTKLFFIKGNGSAYSKAWGGSKELVYSDLSSYKHYAFHVSLTEKVGNNTWYRGILGGKTVWIHSAYLAEKVEESTSRLGQLLNSKVKIYKTLGEPTAAFAAGTKYINTVYFIKKQATIDGEIYYLISSQPSSVNGVVGWVHSSSLKSYTHTGVDKNAKSFIVKGNGQAFSKAWGGKKEVVYSTLSGYKNSQFTVNLTEKVGNNIWYRGTLGGKTVWIHSAYLVEIFESNTSRLGQLLASDVKIYKTAGDSASAFKAGTTYMNAVYFIKKQAKIGEDIYYLISNQPSSVKGVIGWVHASDLKSYTHTGVDKNTKTFYIKGTGQAFSKAWGGSKDLVYSTLSGYKNSIFTVNLTEKVGNNTWYRGVLAGKTVWIHEAYVHEGSVVLKTYTDYNLSLDSMLEIQMNVSPQTDKSYKLWIREDAFGSITNGKGTIKGNNWNLRRGPGTIYLADGQVNDGTVLTIYNEATGTDGRKWYHVRNTTGWVLANPEDVTYYLTPTNFTGSLKDSLQFVKLSESANVNVNEVNQKILAGKGILAGKAQAFIDGGKANGVNEIYLIAHALLETGHGASQLANGVEVGRDSQGKLVLVNDSNRNSLKDIKKTYNMYGINAIDSAPLYGGATYAYEKGWFTPEAAIKGGAAFIGNGYVNKGQDTLYKMRWNPLFASLNNYASHQYATDIGWAYKQTSKMYELYQLLDEYHIVLDIPRYK